MISDGQNLTIDKHFKPTRPHPASDWEPRSLTTTLLAAASWKSPPDRRDVVPADLAARVRLQPERGILPSHDKAAPAQGFVAEPRPDDDVVSPDAELSSAASRQGPAER